MFGIYIYIYCLAFPPHRGLFVEQRERVYNYELLSFDGTYFLYGK